ncbi:MAG: hypothetical protein WCR27_03545, partial [Eubacteriales bacterium]
NGEEENTSELEIVKYKDKLMQQVGMLIYDGYPDKVQIGKVSKEKTAVFVDMIIGAHSAYTQVAALENETLTNLLKQGDDVLPATFKQHPLRSRDIDNDGIIEIGIPTEPPNSVEYSLVEMPWINLWYKWDNNNALTELALEEFSDYEQGYRFNIPEMWKEKYTIKTERDEKLSLTKAEFSYIDSTDKPIATLLSILYLPSEISKEEENKLKESGREYFVVKENSTQVVIAVLPKQGTDLKGAQGEEYQRIILTKDQLKDYFILEK